MEDKMGTAKLFIHGRSQALRLPEAYRFEGTDVYIKRTSHGVLLIPKDKTAWEVWEKNLKKHDTPFMTDRDQPGYNRKEQSWTTINPTDTPCIYFWRRTAGKTEHPQDIEDRPGRRRLRWRRKLINCPYDQGT